MKTISTKVNPKYHEQFLELCNKDGKSTSEVLREIIQQYCDDLYEEEVESVGLPQMTVDFGKILDEEGKQIGVIKGFDDEKDPKPTITIIDD